MAAEWKSEVISGSGDYSYTYTLHTCEIDFGIVDDRGRRLGCRLVIEELPARKAWRDGGDVQRPATVYSRVQSTRNGAKYGAIAPSMEHATLAEAKASVIKRGADSAKRQAAKFGTKCPSCGKPARRSSSVPAWACDACGNVFR